MPAGAHQHIDRESGDLRTERLYQDRLVLFFYDRVREQMPRLFRLLTGRVPTRVLGYLHYDTRWGSAASSPSSARLRSSTSSSSTNSSELRVTRNW